MNLIVAKLIALTDARNTISQKFRKKNSGASSSESFMRLFLPSACNILRAYIKAIIPDYLWLYHNNAFYSLALYII